MSTQAHAVAVNQVDAESKMGTEIVAEVTVTADGSDNLSFSSESRALKITGTDITLKPESSAQQPVLYTLVFRAGDGVDRFGTPSVEFGKQENRGNIAVNPHDPPNSKEFRLSFVNDLLPGERRVRHDFWVRWNPPTTLRKTRPAQPRLVVSTDPTIILDPPNS